MKHSAIVPLIGGELFGTMLAIQNYSKVTYPLKASFDEECFPEEILSFSPFAKNEEHLIKYLRNNNWDGNYVFLDNVKDHTTKDVDMVSAVCPCAGLSSLSPTSSSNSQMNDWMYQTAEYVLNVVRPQVFWGENAPALATKKGKPVADKLFEIGEREGYTLTLVKTKNSQHGIPQKRHRTFYIFTKERNLAPNFHWTVKDQVDSKEVLSLPRYKESDPMQRTVLGNDLYQDELFLTALEITNTKNAKELSEHFPESLSVCKFIVENITDAQLKNLSHPKAKKRITQAKKKLKAGKNYWAHSVTMLKGILPGVVANIPTEGINYFHDDFITVRESLRLMGMPDDFNLVTDPKNSINHVCQNVPVFTARDICSQILKYLNGNIEMNDISGIQTIEIRPESSTKLDSFFG